MSYLITAITTIILSIIFTGSKIAFTSLNNIDLESDKNQTNFITKIINTYSKHYSEYVSTLILANYLSVIIFTIALSGILQEQFKSLLNNNLATTLIIILVVIITLIITNFIASAIFNKNEYTKVKILAIPTFISYALLYIFARIVNLHPHSAQANNNTNLEMLNLNGDSDSETNLDVKILKNALDFSNIKLRECIVPRTELTAIPVDEEIETLLQKFIETGHSKIVVYDESIDNIIGYAHSIKMFENPKSIKSMLRQMPIVPETMPANKLLALFTKQHKSMALVVDEFGGTSGIVTMEDILEELIGEIQDEHDKVKLVDKQISDNQYLLSGRQEIDLINEKYHLTLPESEQYETIAGLILEHHGSIPKNNDNVIINEFEFKVIKATTKKIELVQLTINNPTDEE